MPKYVSRPVQIEAFYFTGQPRTEWPAWLQSRPPSVTQDPANLGRFAVANDKGEFQGWVDAGEFNGKYVVLAASGDDEPVFRIRAQDFCGPEGVTGYADIVARYHGDKSVIRSAREFAGRMTRWQAIHGSKMPDLPGSAHSPRVVHVPDAPQDA